MCGYWLKLFGSNSKWYFFCNQYSCQYLTLLVKHKRCFLISCLEHVRLFFWFLSLFGNFTLDKHLSKCSTWLLSILCCMMPAPLYLSASLPVGRVTRKMKFSGNDSVCTIPLPVYISCDENEFQFCHFLFPLCLFLCEEWLRLHGITQMWHPWQQWHPCLHKLQDFKSLCCQNEECK